MTVAFAPRRAAYLDITTTPQAAPLSADEVGSFETFDMLYRSLCALMFNYVPTSGHPGGSVSSGRIVAGLLLDAMDYDLGDPDRQDADLVSYAAGHKAMGLYAMWALRDEVARVIGLSFRPSWSWFEGNSAATAIFTLRGGALVDYGGTMVSLGAETPQEGLITVIGEKGTLRLDETSRVTLHGPGDTRTLSQDPIPGGELGHALAEFLAAIREKRQPETHVAEHIRSLAVSLAVVESSKQGRWVEIAGQL